MEKTFGKRKRLYDESKRNNKDSTTPTPNTSKPVTTDDIFDLIAEPQDEVFDLPYLESESKTKPKKDFSQLLKTPTPTSSSLSKSSLSSLSTTKPTPKQKTSPSISSSSTTLSKKRTGNDSTQISKQVQSPNTKRLRRSDPISQSVESTSSFLSSLEIEKSFLQDEFDNVFDMHGLPNSSDEETEILSESQTKSKQKLAKKKEESRSEKLDKATKFKRSTEKSKEQSKEQLKKDKVLFCLQELKDVSSTVERKCEALNDLLQLISKEIFDWGTFLRAHELIQPLILQITQCQHNENQLLFLLMVRVLSFLLSDPFNVEYVTENTLSLLLTMLKSHHLFQKSGVSSKLDAKDLQRSVRIRKASLNSPLISSSTTTSPKLEEEQQTLQDKTASLALAALKSCVQHELKSREYLLKEKRIDIISSFIICLELQYKEKRDAFLLNDILNCLSILQDVEYNFTTNWKIFIPALLDSLQIYCPKTHSPHSLASLEEDHRITFCTLKTLQLLTNMSNLNQEATEMLAAEGGITITTQVIASNENVHLDILNICLALLVNLTENNAINRDILFGMKLDLPSGKSNVSFVSFLIDYFVTQYEKEASQDHHQQGVSAAYSAILLACLCRTSKYKTKIQQKLPLQSLQCLAEYLTKFIAFQQELRMLTEHMLHSLESLLEHLQKE